MVCQISVNISSHCMNANMNSSSHCLVSHSLCGILLHTLLNTRIDFTTIKTALILQLLSREVSDVSLPEAVFLFYFRALMWVFRNTVLCNNLMYTMK